MSARQSVLSMNCLLSPGSRPVLAFLLLLISFFVSSGCGHVVQEDVRPPVIPQPSYTLEPSAPEADSCHQWWQVFNDPLLNNHIQRALTENFSLKEGVARLKQARHLQIQEDSRRYPSVDGRVSGGSEWETDGERDESSRVQLELTWEVDLWGRLSAAAKAADSEAEATEDALQGLALLLSTEVADTYFQLAVQHLYQELLHRQVTANETSLAVIKLRFANGAASLVDVYQQQALLASVKARIPLSDAQNIVLRNRLSVLLGQPPESDSLALRYTLPDIPALPKLGVPVDLLQNRPDLRQLQRQLVAADYRVAEAVADRLPGLKIGGAAGWVTGDFLTSIFAEALATIVDWGEKKSEVEKKKAVVEEHMARYSQRYLVAIQEVEDALWQERQHERLLVALNEQLRISKATLRESRSRYIQGVTDYLPVLTALVSFQSLEMDILRRQQERISYRLLLYRGLGGNVLAPELLTLKTEN
ncbi:MAG: efflux transporter outer membrane subunit [Desulfocapsa sp.]|nr:efflux transporter outer membrane subunit [Desulfocapsa sp.]